MKPTALIAAFSLLASGVLAAPSEGNNLVERATCFDCQYNTFQAGRCAGSCRGGEESISGGGQNCKQCVAGCPAASDKRGNSAGYAC
ncbi:hypothetical protein CMUS01_07256 [Colletotrichum musicola]|uniref:4Fe-4S ferredoxin-type domain-containing protein n=1 Tax=Colletotrichum musicola TaxID=2175873 RepID=A0A8H6KHH1_9PEZI|nr:hypothetical protein CMUS01_07256 [Colletotrichum musicola]